ncbi:NADH-quinone oxidoreductase subunit C [Euzebya sp.]|uniref:NADH-quinone oxidoreductase subunit C n=1 Tax=Euzebya sp. TaxID=1971409 RepID=UPI0035110BD9
MSAPTTPADAPLEALAAQFREELGERVLSADLTYDELIVRVTPEAYPEVVRYCKHDLGMAFFDFLSAIDEREEGFSVIARMYDHVSRRGVVVKVMVPGGRDEPRLPSIADVYRGANWHEREAYDMFGIVFEGHPGLLPRILTVENFEGWPLRKEFKLSSRVVKPWPGAKEPGEPGEAEGGSEAAPAHGAAPVPGDDPSDRAAAAKAKAERAKAKAAEARKRKAEEKAAAQAAEGTPDEPAPDAEAGPAPTAAAVDDAEPGSAREAAQAAAGEATSAHTPDPTTPEGASKIADTAVAKDAAAGQTAGQELAPGEQPGSGEPDRDPVAEEAMSKGGPAQDSGTPGVEREGTHDLEESTARTEVSDEPTAEDAASREQAGVGPEGGTGAFADSTRHDHPVGSSGTDDDVRDASAPDAADATDPDAAAPPTAEPEEDHDRE